MIEWTRGDTGGMSGEYVNMPHSILTSISSQAAR